MLRIVVIFIEIIISFLLQTTVFRWFKLAGTVPNMLLILTVAYGFLKGRKAGLFVGIASGLLVDFMYGDLIGITAIIYMVIGYANGYVGKIFNREDKIVPIVLTGFSQFAYFILYYTFNFLLRGRVNIFFYFMTIGLPEIVYTTLIAIIYYRIISFLDVKIDGILKKEA
ncbi:MAG: rod shape-determining protein MreD [Clostridiales bacterium]|nr:rod shape-determining protein MreD [Clostridiales bacterium]